MSSKGTGRMPYRGVTDEMRNLSPSNFSSSTFSPSQEGH